MLATYSGTSGLRIPAHLQGYTGLSMSVPMANTAGAPFENAESVRTSAQVVVPLAVPLLVPLPGAL